MYQIPVRTISNITLCLQGTRQCVGPSPCANPGGKSYYHPHFSSGCRKSAIIFQKARDVCFLVFSLLSAAYTSSLGVPRHHPHPSLSHHPSPTKTHGPPLRFRDPSLSLVHFFLIKSSSATLYWRAFPEASGLRMRTSSEWPNCPLGSERGV